jgi:hypothetical protein
MDMNLSFPGSFLGGGRGRRDIRAWNVIGGSSAIVRCEDRKRIELSYNETKEVRNSVIATYVQEEDDKPE